MIMSFLFTSVHYYMSFNFNWGISPVDSGVMNDSGLFSSSDTRVRIPFT